MSWMTIIVGGMYHAIVLSVITLTYSMLAKKFLKTRAINLGRLDFEDAAKLVLLVAGAVMTSDCLVKLGIIPEDIN